LFPLLRVSIAVAASDHLSECHPVSGAERDFQGRGVAQIFGDGFASNIVIARHAASHNRRLGGGHFQGRSAKSLSVVHGFLNSK
jgi:hypothetical protein